MVPSQQSSAVLDTFQNCNLLTPPTRKQRLLNTGCFLFFVLRDSLLWNYRLASELLCSSGWSHVFPILVILPVQGLQTSLKVTKFERQGEFNLAYP